MERTEIIPTRVTQSKAAANNIDGELCCAGAKAIDRNLQTRTSSVMDDIGEAWLKLEFDKSYRIDKIIIYYSFFTNWFSSGDTVTDYKTRIDNRNNVDVSVYQGEVKQKSCGTLQLTYALNQSDQIYTLLCSTEGDTVKLSKFENKVVVYEVVVHSLLTGISTFMQRNIAIIKDSYKTKFLKNNFKCLI